MEEALRLLSCLAHRAFRWEPVSWWRRNPSSTKTISRGIKARDIDSEVTGMSTGHPVRQIRNKMTREYLKLEKEGAPFEELEYLTLGSLRKAVMDGDVVNGTVMAGQCAGLVTKEQTCKEIIEEVVRDGCTLLGF